MNTPCPCGSNHSYKDCCQPYITGQQPAPNAEALMRSRYTAYSQANTGYIQHTMRDIAARGFNPIEAKQWASQVEWLGLQVFEHCPIDDNTATVTFAARFKGINGIHFIHEKSQFTRDNQQWFYTDGETLPLPTRNEPCLCGSGKKYKRCCSN